jgi:hypothetical protein
MERLTLFFAVTSARMDKIAGPNMVFPGRTQANARTIVQPQHKQILRFGLSRRKDTACLLPFVPRQYPNKK